MFYFFVLNNRTPAYPLIRSPAARIMPHNHTIGSGSPVCGALTGAPTAAGTISGVAGARGVVSVAASVVSVSGVDGVTGLAGVSGVDALSLT